MIQDFVKNALIAQENDTLSTDARDFRHTYNLSLMSIYSLY